MLSKNEQFAFNSIKTYIACSAFPNVERIAVAMDWAKEFGANNATERFGAGQPMFNTAINSLLEKGLITRNNKQSTTYYSVA
jgi:hypothetical protein